MDLTRHTLDGLLKYPWCHRSNDADFPKRAHKWGYYADDAEAFAFTREGLPEETVAEPAERCLEAEIMDWADDVTYAVHDMEDFFRAGLVPLDRLAVKEGPSAPEAKRFAELLEDARNTNPATFPTSGDTKKLVAAVTEIIGRDGPTSPYQHTTNARAEMRTFASKLITNYLEAFSLADDPVTGKVKLRIDDQARLEVDALKMLVVVYVVRRPSLAGGWTGSALDATAVIG